MVNSIEVHIINSVKDMDVYIDCKTLEVKSNGIPKRISRGTVIKFLSFTKSWKEEYCDPESEIKEEYKVIINSDDGEQVYVGKGDFPKNYKGFKAFLTDIR